MNMETGHPTRPPGFFAARMIAAFYSDALKSLTDALARGEEIPGIEDLKPWLLEVKRRMDSGMEIHAALSGTFESAEPVKISPEEQGVLRNRFMAEIARLQADGKSYDQAWELAQTTEPGKSLFAAWTDAARQMAQSAAV